MWRRIRNIHVLLHVRANGDSPVSVAMTHMRWLHGQRWACRARSCRWFYRLAHRHVLETRMRANVNVRPLPLAQRTGEEKERKERERETIIRRPPAAWSTTQTSTLRLRSRSQNTQRTLLSKPDSLASFPGIGHPCHLIRWSETECVCSCTCECACVFP